MNKFLKILGGIFLAILVIIGIGAAILIPKGLALQKEAAEYVATTVPLVVANWDPEDLKKYAATQLLEEPNTKEQLPKLFTWFSALGKLKQLGTPVGQVGTGTYGGRPFKGTWGAYVAEAEFEGGKAQIKVLLRKDGQGWQILGFHIESLALLPKAASPAASVEIK
jgi:hypothetical protein